MSCTDAMDTYIYYMQSWPMPQRLGWQCPQCRTVHSPDKLNCHCAVAPFPQFNPNPWMQTTTTTFTTSGTNEQESQEE